MSRNSWHRKLLESIFYFYNEEVEAEISAAEAELGEPFPSINVCIRLKPLFDANDIGPEQTQNIVLAGYALQSEIAEEIRRGVNAKMPIDPITESIFFKIPETAEEIAVYVILARESDKWLSQLPDEEIAAEYRKLEVENADLRVAKEGIFGEDRDRFEFFNTLPAQADYSFWLLAAYWAPEECVALSLGKDPGRVNSKSLASFLDA